MTLVDIFERIIDGFQYNGDKVNSIIKKSEEIIENIIEKTLNTY